MSIRQLRGLQPAALMTAALLVLAVYLWFWTSSGKPHSETLLIRDLIWLDAWGLLFVFTVAAIWRLQAPWRVKGWLLVAVVAVHGTIWVRLVLDGTPFGLGGYWGDQKFRTAMIEKFVTWWVPADFYYKDLPPFYPPLLYYLLALPARVFGIEAYQMIKICAYAIYLLGPAIVYLMWRKLVTPMQAAAVTLVSFLLLSAGKPFALSAPHAMAGNILFIPWWLYYIEEVRPGARTWRFYATGGVIGGLIFMTYFYGFFLGAFLILLRVTVFRRWALVQEGESFRLVPALKVLGAAALVSLPYWLPLGISILSRGGDKATGWHHIDSVGTQFAFMSVTVSGLLYLAGLVYAVRRFHAALYRSLVLFLGGMIGYYLIGAALGAVDHPVNLIKANEFFGFLAGPFVALPAVALLRAKWGYRIGRGLGALAFVVLLLMVHNVNSIGMHAQVEQARKTQVPDWRLDNDEMQQRAGSVFLSGHEEFPSFYPVFLFVAPNHHYSHPAAHYTERYRLLHELQQIRDPFLFNVILRENRFDRIDFVHLRRKEGRSYLPMVLDNYPNKYTVRELTFDPQALSDRRLLVPLEADGLYAVPVPPLAFDDARFGYTGLGGVDSVAFLARWRFLRGRLTDEGQRITDAYLQADWTTWDNVAEEDSDADFGGGFELLKASAVPVGNDLHLFFTIQCRQETSMNCKFFLHAYRPDGSFENFDFLPTPRTNEWQDEVLYQIHQVIPNSPDYVSLHFGFFSDGKRLGDGMRWDLVSR